MNLHIWRTLAGVTESRKRRKRSSSFVVSEKSRKLLPFNLTEDPNRRLEQMASLATALMATGTEFSNELTYVPGKAPRTANCAAFEDGGMQVMSKEDTETLQLSKKMMERGDWPPLLVVFDPKEGFTVQADRSIRDLTIITECVGDVNYLQNRENDDGDSMMTLLSASNRSQSLVVCSDKHSNIARFINGINNYTPEGKKKQNLKCDMMLVVNVEFCLLQSGTYVKERGSTLTIMDLRMNSQLSILYNISVVTRIPDSKMD